MVCGLDSTVMDVIAVVGMADALVMGDESVVRCALMPFSCFCSALSFVFAWHARPGRQCKTNQHMSSLMIGARGNSSMAALVDCLQASVN
jgi:hypothetical protein